MGRPKTQEDLVCPMCHVDFRLKPFGTSIFKKHMARKNPCVPAEGQVYVRASTKFFSNVNINDFDMINLSHVTGPNLGGRKESWVPSMLHQVFSLDENKCIVLKNKEDYPDMIYVKRRGEVKELNIHDLTILTLLTMHERLFPFLELSGWEKYAEFEEWVESVSGVHLADPNWQGTIEPRSYYYMAVRDFLRNYLFKMKNRRHQNWMLASSTLKTLE